MEHITSFDIVIALIIFILGLKGLIDGFVKEFFGLAGIIGGIYFGSRYADTVGSFIDHNIITIKNEAALTFVGFLVGLFGIWIAMALLGNLVTKLTHMSGLGFFNRLFGVLFGWAKIFLIFAVIIYAISSMEITKRVLEKYTKNSILYPLMIQTGAYIIKLKPEDFVSQDVQGKSSRLLQNTKKDLQTKAIHQTIDSTAKKLNNSKE
ncbi:CvpA family protein [Nitratiruptor sp. SB155-2]|uniref:CvpA family protein n=1 Tax=Nitratiruptor sp. (strain SB155-2) TaxID=387092 RepID=UPI00015870AF|nr:CvpA family protein [Nitratiruptor sp. SB155-2]BAF70285.1 colicin V production protein [Nitratiruptor sp. SB155-2]